MISYLNSSTVTSYHTAAVTYGLPELAKGAVEWLEHNIMIDQSPDILHGIDQTLMKRIIASPNLAVIQVEMDVYQLLKRWLFVQLNPDRNFNTEISSKEIMPFLKTQRRDSLSILESIDEKYLPVFQGLRLAHIITDFKCAGTLENENIIPRSWINQEYRSQWLRMLRVENSFDAGPSEEMCRALQDHERELQTNNNQKDQPEHITHLFHAAMRCGRILDEQKDFCWRWTGYNYGFDLIMTYDHQKHQIRITRNCVQQEVSTSVSMKPHRSLVCKIKVFSLKNDGCLDLSHSSGWRHFEISKDQERNVIQIQRRPRRKSEERGKMFMVAYIIFAEAAGTNFYLPKSLLIKKNNQGTGSNIRRLSN